MNEALESTLRIKYLLGQATEEESLQVEESYFQSPDYHESMLALEEELIRQYLNHELSPEQCARFETHFLATERRQKKFHETRNLIEHINQAHPAVMEQAIAAPSLLQRAEAYLKSLSALLIWNTQVASVAIMLLVLAGGTFYLYLHRKQASETIAQAPSVNMAAPSTQGLEENLAGNPTSPERAKFEERSRRVREQSLPSTSRAPGATQKQPQNTLGAIINLPTFRSISPKVIELPIPAKSKQVRLNIPLEEAEYVKYKIIIKDTEGLEIVRHGDIRPHRSGSQWNLIFPLRTEALKQTDYVINLYGASKDNEEKLIVEGFFRPNFQK